MPHIAAPVPILATTTPNHSQKNARCRNGANGEAETAVDSEASVTTPTIGPANAALGVPGRAPLDTSRHILGRVPDGSMQDFVE
jgi:hypothetical protein